MEDGIKDILVSIGEEIFKFLHRNIDSFELPDIIKKILKILKANFIFVPTVKNHDQS